MLAPLLALLALASIPTPADTVAIRAGRVLDVRTGQMERGVIFLIQDGRIAARGRDLVIPAGVRVIDASSYTILPGLIDAHVHLTINGLPRENAARTLLAGFTTVADLGSANGAGVRLKRLIDSDSIIGPTMLAAGSWIGGRGGVCEFGGATIRGAEEAGARAGSDLAGGADLLKVCVSGWINDAAAYPDSVEMTAEEIGAVVARARAAGVAVAAHATSRAAVAAALNGKIRLLAHTPIVDEAGAAAIANSGACVVTTMTTLLAADSAAALRQSFARLRRAGVTLALGTDAGVLTHGSNADELLTLAALGMSPLEVLRAGTTVAARCLGLPEYGVLERGAVADLVAVSGDPLLDLSVLKTPVFVMHRGKIFQSPEQ
ncbi:MAG TPA: amidohydrolase family protein [Gemmatimonadales bacterium]|nr:amidohydrolase family protein [Gemmatimonadales bacterium]